VKSSSSSALLIPEWSAMLKANEILRTKREKARNAITAAMSIIFGMIDDVIVTRVTATKQW
jgi:hypothetical protein